MAASSSLWHGTRQELAELYAITDRNCGCTRGAWGAIGELCAPHAMLEHDQRALDGLLFARRIADRLRREEASPVFAPDGQWQPESVSLPRAA